MVLFSTIGRYFAARFIAAIAAVFLTVFILIFTIDFVELLRRTGEAEGATSLRLARLAMYRTPATAEQILPFAILFAALATFLNLSRKLELVIARAAGLSAWQFTLPAVFVAAVIGVIATTAYNPVSTELKDAANKEEGVIFGREAQIAARGQWLRQRSIDGEAILRFAHLDEQTFVATDATAFVMNKDGTFLERIEAPTAKFMGDHWRFSDARILTAGFEPEVVSAYLLPTFLTRDQVRSAVGQSQAVSFWALPDVVRSLELAGLDTTRYRLRYQTLLARPALLLAMVLIAASVSLRFLRSGGFASMVLSGVAAGFVLYVASRIVEDLGNAGIVSTVFAAWAAPTIGAMLGSLTLLYREDG